MTIDEDQRLLLESEVSDLVVHLRSLDSDAHINVQIDHDACEVKVTFESVYQVVPFRTPAGRQGICKTIG